VSGVLACAAAFALPWAAIGAFYGIVFGALRLAGVDFGKWYRDPGEISEGRDRSWIGLYKWTALSVGRWLLPLLAGGIVAVIVRASPGAAILAILCLALGFAAAQALVGAAWHFGLKRRGHSTQIRLSRVPGAAAAPKPRPRARRRLIVFCDGTWNSPSMARETNVVQLMRATKPVDAHGRPQIAYYHLGVGTGNFVDRFLGGGAGVGLASSVKSCYRFLVNNYQPGDEILLFGFSRGAYVVRSLAGLIGLVGLLRKGRMFRFDEIWDYYKLPPHQRGRYPLDRMAQSRTQRRHPVEVACIGVWDTVGALGIPGSRFCSRAYSFDETSLGSHVRYAFQALAMDERRGNFQPAVWVRQNPEQVLEQVWFPGVHSDVGGGYVEHGLADATLLWMAAAIERHGLLELYPACLAAALGRATVEPYAIGTLHDSRGWFWKAIAGAVPRPVGITDDSERIHASAFTRAAASAGPTYGGNNRKNWLATIPLASVALRRAFEKAFPPTPPGDPYIRLVPRRGGICAWLGRRIFGDA
jgi:hypothetical protein